MNWLWVFAIVGAWFVALVAIGLLMIAAVQIEHWIRREAR